MKLPIAFLESVWQNDKSGRKLVVHFFPFAMSCVLQLCIACCASFYLVFLLALIEICINCRVFCNKDAYRCYPLATTTILGILSTITVALSSKTIDQTSHSHCCLQQRNLLWSPFLSLRDGWGKNGKNVSSLIMS